MKKYYPLVSIAFGLILLFILFTPGTSMPFSVLVFLVLAGIVLGVLSWKNAKALAAIGILLNVGVMIYLVAVIIALG